MKVLSTNKLYVLKNGDTMSKIVLKQGALLAPVPPVMVSCGCAEKPNIITIGWTGIVNTLPPMTYISVRPQRYSHDIIKESGEFVINLSPARLVKEVDYCGVKSGSEHNKFSEMNLTPQKSSIVSSPLIAECPINLECKVKSILPLGSHDMFLAEIVAVNADETLLDNNGRLDFEKAGLMAYSHGEYFELGKKLGSFGFSVKKKKKKYKGSKNR